MKSIVEKLRKLETSIANEKGRFGLFALFLREESPDRWDFVVSAPWIPQDQSYALRYFAERVKKVLAPDELLRLSRIVIIEPDNPALNILHQVVQVEHGIVEFHDNHFFGLQIKSAYIITSRPVASSVSK